MGKNWEWSYKQGRIKRIKAEASAKLNGTPFNPSEVPLHSYDGTMQSKFAQGLALRDGKLIFSDISVAITLITPSKNA